jgi:hypothetical protein
MRRVVGLVGLLISLSGWAGGPRLVTVQRDAAATAGDAVQDCYVWQEAPDYNGNSDTLYVGLVGTTDKETFLRFDVSSLSGLVVRQARLVLQTMGTSGQPIEVHVATAPWAETEPTWATFGSAYKPQAWATFTPVAGRNTVDVTGVAESWVAGGTNDGVVLVQATLTPSTEFYSSDHPTASLRPALELLVDDPPPPDAPLVTSDVPALEASCSVAFRYPLKAHAPDATSFTLSSSDGVALDATTGELTWTPDRAARGVHEWMVTVSDGARTENVPVTVDVQCSEPLRVGCTAAPVGSLAWVAGLVLALRRRRRAPTNDR